MEATPALQRLRLSAEANMRIPSKLLVASIAWLWAAGALHAGLITLSLDPTGGAIAILPGQTSGWGFTLDDQSAGWISVTSSALTFETNPSLGLYTDFIGLQGGPDPSFAVAPFVSWSQAFDSVSSGLGSYNVSSSAAPFAEDTGLVLVSFDIFDGDPTNGGMQTGSSSVSAAFKVDIARPPAQVPEPSSLRLTVTAILAMAAVALRRYESA
jgi:hypothetical protein